MATVAQLVHQGALCMSGSAAGMSVSTLTGRYVKLYTLSPFASTKNRLQQSSIYRNAAVAAQLIGRRIYSSLRTQPY